MVCAFHFYHDWSHQKAFEHTERESGFGAGVFVNYLFLLVWAGDALYWWLAPSRYDERRAWIGFLVHSFLAFIIFSATVVFGAGGIRWFGAVMFAELGGSWILQRSRQQK
ncbi:MAG: hypothetical protein KatS3mg105_3971 [Gemmatales bacterium]|nr:MAG: hypothetical protein KatS3mg105_3971 [Gemmatales bacterium]